VLVFDDDLKRRMMAFLQDVADHADRNGHRAWQHSAYRLSEGADCVIPGRPDVRCEVVRACVKLDYIQVVKLNDEVVARMLDRMREKFEADMAAYLETLPPRGGCTSGSC